MIASKMQSTNTTGSTIPMVTPTSAGLCSTGVVSVLNVFVVVLKTFINVVDVMEIVPSSFVKRPVLNVKKKKKKFS